MTAMSLASDTVKTPSVFSCGISVAPVTDWLLYGKDSSVVCHPRLDVSCLLNRLCLHRKIHEFSTQKLEKLRKGIRSQQSSQHEGQEVFTRSWNG